MIAVIADDLTGAAELGGIGLRYGLTVEVNMEVKVSSGTDLLVIASDTRSMKEEDAVKEMERITEELLLLKPEWVYKKTDSVLRGHVVKELEAHLKILGMKRALLVPANPELGRTIKDGQYLLYGEPVHKSSFSMDPEFAVTSSSVLDMLHTDGETVRVKRYNEGLPDTGIIVGEVLSDADLETWASIVRQTKEPLLTAGAFGFFMALLKGGLPQAVMAADPVGEGREGYPVLFVSGTTFGRNQEFIRGISQAGGPVSYINAEVMEDRGMNRKMEELCEVVVNNLLDQGRAIIAIEGMVSGDQLLAARKLRSRMAQLVSRVLDEVDVEELVIEGGATAYAILEQAGLRTFFPEEELAPGVVRMRVESLYVIVKPGSYEWPVSLRRRLENK